MDKGHLLTVATFLPAVGAAVVAALRDSRAIRVVGVVVTGFVFGLVVGMAAHMVATGERFAVEAPWISMGQLRIDYRLGGDGISLALAALTALLVLLCALYSIVAVREGVRGATACLLALETGMLGVFFALDLFLFYVFWEAALIPMVFLIGIWGGERRVRAAVKFLIYTVVGSLAMLVAAVWVYRQTGTLDMTQIPQRMGQHGAAVLPFLAFAFAFAIKVPLVPFHTWLPDAHVEAPTAGSVILAGVLLKMGVYGLLRIAIPFFPQAAEAAGPWFQALGAAGAVYGALMALVQTDIKKLIAYTSVSHMGFVVLALFARDEAAAQGAVLQSVGHGISTGALFFLVGVLYERAHVRGTGDFGGLARVTPGLAAVWMVITLSSIGLPGTNGFVGEFLILAGAFQAGGEFARACVVVAGTAVILGAVVMLGLYRRVFWGPPATSRWRSMADLGAVEWVTLAPLVVLVFILGVQPGLVLDLTAPAWEGWSTVVGRGP